MRLKLSCFLALCGFANALHAQVAPLVLTSRPFALLVPHGASVSLFPALVPLHGCVHLRFVAVHLSLARVFQAPVLADSAGDNLQQYSGKNDRGTVEATM